MEIKDAAVSAVKQIGEFVKEEDELISTPDLKIEPVRPRVTSEERKFGMPTKRTSIQGVQSFRRFKQIENSSITSFVILRLTLKLKT